MKKFLLLSVVFLIACTKQDLPKPETADNTKIVPYANKHYTNSDPVAHLDFIQFAQVVINTLSKAQASYNSDATEVKLLPKGTPSDSRFETFNDWYSVKILRNADSENWGSFLVEVYDSKGYEQSKDASFNACKEVWKNIDNRMPEVIDELSNKIKNYEDSGSSPETTQVRFGYWVHLNASHYKEGYPVVCQIAYDKK
ncbi:hypothetical protein MMP74_13860 [Acinetobacter sp. NIPH 1869]|uniref:hypothetical protein n=1 Tax=Acinetobacter higginsii TaxID=70347 RepID=UPI001F4B0C37|nr:hypothetical protein [Acinetobacter higginsii]MCH7305449.1 hypothetical protein [Acinetobacter higginsii]